MLTLKKEYQEKFEKQFPEWFEGNEAVENTTENSKPLNYKKVTSFEIAIKEYFRMSYNKLRNEKWSNREEFEKALSYMSDHTANFERMKVVSIVLNEGWIPKMDGSENRWYSWYSVSSGFEFDDSCYVTSIAGASSASRLCLKEKGIVVHLNKQSEFFEMSKIHIIS